MPVSARPIHRPPLAAAKAGGAEVDLRELRNRVRCGIGHAGGGKVGSRNGGGLGEDIHCRVQCRDIGPNMFHAPDAKSAAGALRAAGVKKAKLAGWTDGEAAPGGVGRRCFDGGNGGGGGDVGKLGA